MNEQQIKRKISKWVWIAVAVLALGLGFGYYRMRTAPYETTDDAQVDGNLVPVRSAITAYVAQVRFRDNQEVQAGDTLMVCNTTQLRAKVAQAQATLEGARANLGVSGLKVLASLANAKAYAETASTSAEDVVAAQSNLDKAQKDLDRMSRLLSIQALTREQYEAAENRYQVAQAAYAQAKGKQDASWTNSKGMSTSARADQGQISTAEAVVRQREAELAAAEDALTHAYIIAPQNGIVTKRTVEEGQYVSEGQTLCALIDVRHVWITANFKETQVQKIKPGQSVEISLDAFPDLHLRGYVDSYQGATGAKFSLLPPDNATGNFIKITQRVPVKVTIDSSFFMSQNKPTGLYLHLFPGLSASLKVKVD